MIVLRTSEETKTHAYSLGKAETHPSPLRSPQRAYFFYSESAGCDPIRGPFHVTRLCVETRVIISTLWTREPDLVVPFFHLMCELSFDQNQHRTVMFMFM
jgi:hypothetical protein